ncbi:phage portal protein [Pantoea sp. BAV 3049]|uniref:phage portal protein n=1 Tax=Pantoea sp. BAV 3049 TaxID=2654188 RepID=UPI00131E12D5|nr:phage portal protein [Pantoea sp. BAV 3049]
MFSFFRKKPSGEKALQAANGGSWRRIFESFTGAWQRNIEVDSATVLAYHAVFSCISLISADIAKMPLLLKKKLSNDIWADHEDVKISPLLRKPNNFQTRMQFFESWMNSKLSDGNTYVLKIRDPSGQVAQWRVLDPGKVTPYVTDDGEIFYQVRPDNVHGIETQVMVPAREIIHDRFNCFFHPLCGLSPIYACGLTAMQGDAILTNSANHFKNGGKPGGVIKVPGAVDQDKAKEIKAAWDEGYSGANAGKTGLLADGADFMTIAMTAVDAQMVEQLKLTQEIVCSTFHVPIYKVDTSTAPSYNNIEALDQQYYSQCLQTHIEAMEILLDESLGLDAQTGVEFDLDVLIRMDTEGRYKAYKEGIAAGFLTPNQARLKENMSPVEGGDTPYMQQQNYSLAALAKRDAQDNPFASGTTVDTAPETPPEEDEASKALPEQQRSMAVSMLRGIFTHE